MDYLLSAGVNVVIYSGQLDIICATQGIPMSVMLMHNMQCIECVCLSVRVSVVHACMNRCICMFLCIFMLVYMYARVYP